MTWTTYTTPPHSFFPEYEVDSNFVGMYANVPPYFDENTTTQYIGRFYNTKSNKSSDFIYVNFLYSFFSNSPQHSTDCISIGFDYNFAMRQFSPQYKPINKVVSRRADWYPTSIYIRGNTYENLLLIFFRMN